MLKLKDCMLRMKALCYTVYNLKSGRSKALKYYNSIKFYKKRLLYCLI